MTTMIEDFDDDVPQESKYWLSPLGGFDDFDRPYKGVMYDAKTKFGPWANMTEESYMEHRYFDKLGLGKGQKYVKQPDGRWLKVEG